MTTVTKQKSFIVYSEGFVCTSVCTNLPIKEATERLNTEQPTGIGSQWHKSTDKTFSDGKISDGKTKNGAACPYNKGNKHYLFNC